MAFQSTTLEKRIELIEEFLNARLQVQSTLIPKTNKQTNKRLKLRAIIVSIRKRTQGERVKL